MTAPTPTPATLDAAVEAAASACIGLPDIDIRDVRLIVTVAAPILAAGHVGQLAQAHAAGTAEGAAAERERIVALLDRRIASRHLTEDAIKWIRFARSVIQADANTRLSAELVTRAGTSEVGE